VPSPKPTPAPKPVPAPKPGLGGLECAERTILLAAKKNVAQKYGNSPVSGGYCAMGVRTSLQLSRVGRVTDGLGNAIDYLRTIKPHGFVDSGGRDPRKAAPGAILVFSGPHTPDYLKNGRYGKPAGDWLGHVTIKGDDGRYYTDGRTREPAVGWANGVTQEHRRNIAGAFVPGSALAAEYAGKCSRLVEEEQAVDLYLAAVELNVLPYEDEASREAGRRLVKEGLEVLARGDSPSVFAQALALAREGMPFDEEGELTQALADRLRADPALEADLERFTADRGIEHGLEQCKTRTLETSLARALCLKAAGVEGQDLAGASCAPALTWESCLATSAGL
jgi:hypothetical protein